MIDIFFLFSHYKFSSICTFTDVFVAIMSDNQMCRSFDNTSSYQRLNQVTVVTKNFTNIGDVVEHTLLRLSRSRSGSVCGFESRV